MKRPFKFTERIRSFSFAFSGIKTMFISQHNVWIHATATIVVILAALFFCVSPLEWCVLVVAIVAVWIAEAFNTAFEFLADLVSSEFHPLVQQAKDIAAAAVLIAALGAVVLGVIIFVPYIIAMFEK